MVEVQLQAETEVLLNDPLFGEADLDTKIRQLLESEYLRRLGGYKRTNRTLIQKYAMDFDQFLAERVVENRGYSWEVEKDAMDWENALGGMQTMERKLTELRTHTRD